MTKLFDVYPMTEELSEKFQKDVNKYLNQGGFLGVISYFLTYLKTTDEDIAETAAYIPTHLFVMSSLHDDAIDESTTREEDLKQFLNLRTTAGDIIFTRAVNCIDDLPHDFDCRIITEQFREIGVGQINEEEVNSADLSLEEAIERVEERGSVWGELAVSPVESADYFTDTQLNQIQTVCANLLFILTVVDDVEDIPEDIENNIINIPVILYEKDYSEYDSKQVLIDDLLKSDVPEQLDSIIDQRETEMEAACRQFFDESQYTKSDFLTAWNRALAWYRQSICTVPVEEHVPENQQQKVREDISSDNYETRQSLLKEVLIDFPVRFESREEVAATLSTLPASNLEPAIIMMLHIEQLVDSLMTTQLEDALDNLREASKAHS